MLKFHSHLRTAAGALRLSSFMRKQHTLPVCSHNEWDPLEEVIVGRIEGAIVPPFSVETRAVLDQTQRQFFEQNAGKRYPEEVMKKAHDEVENLCQVLESEGVKVRRPDVCDFNEEYKTPDFYSSVGYHNAMPRDLLLIVGNEIIEAPMSWRCRFFEYRSYRSLLKEYFSNGAKWTTCPKPLMSDELYDSEYPITDMSAREKLVEAGKYIVTEFEPCFDAADFYRAGKDIFALRSNTTNYSGINWLKRNIGDKYNIHILSFDKPYAKHIDSSMCIPKPGLVLINSNPEKEFKHKDLFEKAGWKVIDNVPIPATPSSHPMWASSKWLSVNTLSLDTERIVVEENELPLIEFYEKLGFKCIKVPFRHAYSIGGGVHCYTSDIRRRGELQSYF